MLKLARQEITLLKQQMAEDKEAFQKSYDQVQLLQKQQDAEHAALQAENVRLKQVCEEQDRTVQEREAEIQVLGLRANAWIELS